MSDRIAAHINLRNRAPGRLTLKLTRAPGLGAERMEATTTEHPNAIIAGGYKSKRIGHIEDLEIIRCSDGMLYSAWKLNWRERLRALFGGRIWVAVFSERQPPIGLLSEFWPWNEEPETKIAPRWLIKALEGPEEPGASIDYVPWWIGVISFSCLIIALIQLARYSQ